MTITFADGTSIEVAAAAFDDFIRHDLKWVEFVHGRAAEKPLRGKLPSPSRNTNQPAVRRCPSRSC